MSKYILFAKFTSLVLVLAALAIAAADAPWGPN